MSHDQAASHDRDAIRHQLGLAQNVRGDDEGGAAGSLLAKVAAHVRGRDRIEACRGLIAKDPFRLVEGRPDQGHLLRHAPRVGRQHSVGAVGELKSLQQIRNPLLALGLGHPVEVAEMFEVLRRCVATV